MKKFLTAILLSFCSLNGDVYDYMPTIENGEQLAEILNEQAEINYKRCRECREVGDIEGYNYFLGKAEGYSDSSFWSLMIGRAIPQ